MSISGIELMFTLSNMQTLLHDHGRKLYHMSPAPRDDWRCEMLTAIRPYMTPEKQVQIDMLLAVAKVGSVFASQQKL